MSLSISIVVILISILKAQTSIECGDESGCQSETISKAQISCSGFKSCIDSSLTSTKATGFINCGGASSCGDIYDTPATITATKNVFCSALRGCQKASISAKSLDCGGYYSCNDFMPSTAIEIDTIIDCTSSYGCDGNYFKPGKKVNCDGYGGCRSATIERGIGVNCRGYIGCYMGTLTNQRKFVSCGGAGSCSNTEISNTGQIKAYGYFALLRADVTGVSTIKAFGSQALKNAIIDSDGLSDMTIQAYGELAGNLGTVICRSGSTCNLVCKGTGCSGLVYECETGATCNIDPDGCLLDNAVTDVNGVICPDVTTTTTSEAKNAWIKMAYDDGNDNDDEMLHVIDHEVMMKIETDADTTCSSESECDGDTIDVDGNDLYCAGRLSCSTATIGALNGAAVYCDGQESCNSAVVSTADGAIRCNGEGSCKMGDITSNLLYCYALESCMEGDIQVSGSTALCAGDSSCYGATVSAPAGSVFCAGSQGCVEADISGASVDCDGSYACKEASITSSGNIKCIGNYACQKALSLTGSIIIARGSCGAMRSTIKADKVEGLGYHSLFAAEIDSVGRDTVIVQAYGYDSGDTATFTCRSGSECTLDCKTSGCDNLDYVCVNGATCNIDPVECETGTRNKFQGVDCPTITNAASDQEADEFLKQKRIKNKELYAKLDEYAEYMMDNDDEFDMDFDEYLSQQGMELFGDIDIMNRGYMMNDIGKMYQWKIGGIIVLLVISMAYLCYKIKSGKEDYEMLA